MHLIWTVLLALFFALVPGERAVAASCTDGLDCYCDCVKGPAGFGAYTNQQCSVKEVPVDTSVLLCEDFEAPSLHENATPTARFGDGAPLYGPWYDDTGAPGLRGNNSYWTKTYGAPVTGCGFRWNDTDPIIHGSRCNYGVSPGQCYAGEWSSGNIWSANSFACLDIVKDGEFDDEVATVISPIKPLGGNGVWDGQQTMGFRTGAGLGNTAGITGQWNFRTVTELGITMALAYASNSGSSGVWGAAWKHDEFINTYNELTAHWNLGRVGLGGAQARPYSSVMLNATVSGASQAACEAAVTNANVFGTLICNQYGILYGADATAYSQSRDFPWGTWGCHQAYISGLGTSNVTLRLWHNEVLVYEMTNFDGNALRVKGFKGMSWNNYTNANQGLGETPTTETTYRYQDNVHLREGLPVSCNQIGFGTPPVVPAPTATKGVNFGDGITIN